MTQKNILVVAPHPDDETLGCGGTLLKHKKSGEKIHWVIVTRMEQAHGYSQEAIQRRQNEIAEVARAYNFDSVQEMGFPTTKLDTVPLSDIIEKLAAAFRKIAPHTIYLPYGGDAHSDHRVVFNAASACTKWFRQGSINRLLVYETPSETDFGVDPDCAGFRPQTFIDVSEFLDRKIDIMNLYPSEMGVAPFPRSEDVIRSLAKVRGSAMGSAAAEAFILLREFQR